MRVSLVINTYNRARQLHDCLHSLSHLEFDGFEVIVVNGPSTDATAEICKPFESRIKYVECAERNLSISRNAGIAHAAGDIVAFIDDDAIPHPKWLAKIIPAYEDPKVVGVGGFTVDHTGRKFQAVTTLCDRFGHAYSTANAQSPEAFCFPGTPLYPSLLGTNSTFRRSALEAIGGFDETFAYFLDETDVCLRLIDAGGKITYVAEALVYHRYAPSHLRTPSKVPTTLFVQARSKAYFMYRHGAPVLGEKAVNEEIEKYQSGLKRDNDWLRTQGHLSPSAETLLNHDVERGIEEGRAKSRNPAPTNLAQRSAEAETPSFIRFNAHRQSRMRIAMVSQGYPPSDTSGIARWTHAVATGLAARGHNVHVITRATEDESSDYESGVWIHRIQAQTGHEDYLQPFTKAIDLPDAITNWAAAVCNELLRIGPENLDIISAPIWDLEGIIAWLTIDVPLVTSLHTTYRLAYPHKPDWRRPLYYWNHVKKIIDGEHLVFSKAPYFLGNTHAVVKEICEAYGVDISDRTIVVPHGVAAPESIAAEPSGDFTVLFVGRQEYRKGFDTALAAAERVCAEIPGIQFRFVGAPTADDVCQKSVQVHQARVVGTDLARRITIEGYLPDNELMQAYGTCDVFLAPSRFESFGLVAIEAMRFGKPVVAGRSGGLVEVVQHMENGILVDPDDAADIASAIARLYTDRDLRQRLGSAARSVFISRYTTETMVIGIEDAYRHILSSLTRGTGA